MIDKAIILEETHPDRAEDVDWARCYRRHEVWIRLLPGTCAIFVCFEALGSGAFFVQSADYYSLPLDEKTRVNLARQALEVFIEGEPGGAPDRPPRARAARSRARLGQGGGCPAPGAAR